MPEYDFEVIPDKEYETEAVMVQSLFPEKTKWIEYLKTISTTVVDILYRTRPDAIPKVESVELKFSVFDGIAYTTGDEYKKQIYFSLEYIHHITKQKSLDLNELYGVLVHEMVHVWQHSNGIPGGLLEGIADYVRIRAGGSIGWEASLSYRERWDVGYRTTAFFLLWIQEQKKIINFISNLNGNLKYRKWDPMMIKEFTGLDTKELWREYQSGLNNEKLVIDVVDISSGYYSIECKTGFLSNFEQKLQTSPNEYKWEVIKKNDRCIIRDPLSRKVLDVYAYAQANGSQIVLWDENDGTNQIWDICKPLRRESEAGLLVNEYLIISEYSGKALTKDMTQWDANLNDDQRWTFHQFKE